MVKGMEYYRATRPGKDESLLARTLLNSRSVNVGSGALIRSTIFMLM